MLIPFVFDAPRITPDLLGEVLKDAPAAIPEVLKVGTAIVNLDSDTLQSMCDSVSNVIGGLDGRLAMQYSLLILCTQMVS